MKKKNVASKAKKVSSFHHMGHGTDDLTMIILAGGAFVVMIAVVILTGNIVVSQGGSTVQQVSASESGR